MGGEGKILYNVMSIRRILVWEERVRYCTM